jgi:hypothetical protein
MKIPKNLKHKPVIVSENYERVDGRTAFNSDAKGISLGLAQWNERGNVDISAKVWRHTKDENDGKWSRQSEELPLHRVLDLAILIARASKYFREEAYKNEKLFNSANPHIDRIGMQGDAMNIDVCVENDFIDQDIKLFANSLGKDSEILGERMKILANILKEMGY